ncbi:MAG TPA: cell division protein ZapA [Petrotogaceae bacterium]|nr:cell division protein ZapA [Petrotogaceae bacterium]HQF32792.1 cell division protein ZapA [Petrotogaceae bacterium]HQI79075.1 cell division protein ZapA [Petrotogaceae bacterium]
MSKSYRDVQIEILDKIYRYKVDESSDMIDPVLSEIKNEVEKYIDKVGKSKLDEVLVLLLLNEKLENMKTKAQLDGLVRKIGDIVDPIQSYTEER